MGILDFTVLFDNQGGGLQLPGIDGLFDGKGDFPGIGSVNGIDRLNLQVGVSFELAVYFLAYLF